MQPPPVPAAGLTDPAGDPGPGRAPSGGAAAGGAAANGAAARRAAAGGAAAGGAAASGGPAGGAAAGGAASGRAASLLAWGVQHLRILPWRQTRDPWAVLVSEVMAQQTGVDRVVPYWHAFLARFPTPAACAAAPVGDVVRLWSGLGYNRRAVNLHRCAMAAVERHGGALPADLDALLALPGVGPYTARAVLAFALERSVGVVDTNVGRVLARWEGRALRPAEAQALADSLVRTAEQIAAGQAAGQVAADHAAGQRAVDEAAGQVVVDEAGGQRAADQTRPGAPGSLPGWEHPTSASGGRSNDGIPRRATDDVDDGRGGPVVGAQVRWSGGRAGPAWVWNQAVMELGGTVCRRRRPDCAGCPVRRSCAWAAAGLSRPDPADGSAGVSSGQPRFEGSDRQGRGRLVEALCRGPVQIADVADVMGWPDDPARADRVAVGLLNDGLAVCDGDVLRLP